MGLDLDEMSNAAQEPIQEQEPVQVSLQGPVLL